MTEQKHEDARGAPQSDAALDAWVKLPHDLKNATSRAVFVTWHENLNVNMTERCERVAAAVMAAVKAYNAEITERSAPGLTTGANDGI